jgi:hypothetical protein
MVMLAMLLAAAIPILAQEAPAPEEPAPAQEEATPAEPADSPPGPSPDTTVTLSFELTVKGKPPQGTAFLGFIPAEGGISVSLVDPDGDRVYTGSTTLDSFGPGPRPVPPGTELVSLPVQIVQENGGNIEVIRDFGVVPLDGDKMFRAKVSFRKDRGGTTTPEGAGPDSPTSNTDGTANNPADPESGEDINQDGLINETDGEVAAAVSDAAIDAAKSSSESTLPATGGPASLTLFVAGLTGLILATGGLLAHRSIR